MPLNPQEVKRIKGLTINTFFVATGPQHCAAAPVGIILYQFKELPTKATCTSAEYYSRLVKFGKLQFVPNYFVDAAAAWKISVGPRKDKLEIVVCGTKPKAQQNLIKLLCILLKENKMGLNAIEYKANFSQEFKDNLQKEVVNQSIPLYEPLPQPKKIIAAAAQIPPEMTFDLSKNSVGIDGVRISVTKGDLKYRVHLWKGQWTDWVNNGTVVGIKNFAIDGIQIEFELEGYKLYYSFGFKGSKPIKYRTSNYLLPTNKPFDYLDFKLLKD